MIEEIQKQLLQLAADRDIRILLAVESGSRAWGFPSPDSDFDVRIIYISRPETYLSIRERKDNLTYFHGELLDISGWDIRKALNLLAKSNATLLEWGQSPIVYQEEAGFRERLMEQIQTYFQPYHSINHYKGIAQNSYKLNPLSGEIKLKKLFYVLRPVLAAKWILKRNSIPPIEIGKLLDVTGDESIRKKITDLIQVKSKANEDFVYQIDAALKEYISHEMDLLDQLEPPEKRDIPDIKALDVFFRQLLTYPS